MGFRLMKAAYSAHRVSKLQALSDSVLVEDMTFDERLSNGGIGRVYAVGPEQQDVHVGEWILVAHGRWTRGLDIEDDAGKRTIRKIDPKDILMSADERPTDVTFSDAINVEKKER
jgi:hypothetical protein